MKLKEVGDWLKGVVVLNIVHREHLKEWKDSW